MMIMGSYPSEGGGKELNLLQRKKEYEGTRRELRNYQCITEERSRGRNRRTKLYYIHHPQ